MDGMGMDDSISARIVAFPFLRRIVVSCHLFNRADRNLHSPASKKPLKIGRILILYPKRKWITGWWFDSIPLKNINGNLSQGSGWKLKKLSCHHLDHIPSIKIQLWLVGTQGGQKRRTSDPGVTVFHWKKTSLDGTQFWGYLLALHVVAPAGHDPSLVFEIWGEWLDPHLRKGSELTIHLGKMVLKKSPTWISLEYKGASLITATTNHLL